jgi:hypothetical protein
MASGKTSSYCSLGGEHTMNMKDKLIMAIIAVLSVLAIVSLVDASNNPVSCQVDSLVATYGDTYWTLSSDAGCVGGYDKQSRVGQIIDLNGGSADLRHGQLVIFPTK